MSDEALRTTDTLMRLPAVEADPELAEALVRSAQLRAEMTQKFGFVPLSILHLARGALSNRMFNYQREVPARKVALQGKSKQKEARLKALGKKGSASQKQAGRGKAGISIMPAELVDYFVKYYAKAGDTYLDPFMGQGIRMQVAHLRKLDYYGYDLSREFFTYADAVASKIDADRTHLRIFQGDSRHPTQVPDACGDFGFTSPPYWDIEFYGDEVEQLGRPGVSYADFLVGMREVALAWFPKFKDNATFVVNVNDFRKDGKFYAYHADLIVEFRRAGWYLHDIWLIEGLVGGMSKSFAVDFNIQGIAPKVHEFALVFKKTPQIVTDLDDEMG